MGARMTLFAGRPKVGGSIELQPLSAGRLAMLEERDHPLAVALVRGGEDVAVSTWEVFALLLVCSLDERTPEGMEELAELASASREEWDRAVREYGLRTPDEVLAGFVEVMEGELEAIRAAQVVPKKKAARGARPARKTRATRRTGG